jgi:hypothetical protein
MHIWNLNPPWASPYLNQHEQMNVTFNHTKCFALTCRRLRINDIGNYSSEHMAQIV